MSDCFTFLITQLDDVTTTRELLLRAAPSFFHVTTAGGMASTEHVNVAVILSSPTASFGADEIMGISEREEISIIIHIESLLADSFKSLCVYPSQ